MSNVTLLAKFLTRAPIGVVVRNEISRKYSLERLRLETLAELSMVHVESLSESAAANVLASIDHPFLAQLRAEEQSLKPIPDAVYHTLRERALRYVQDNNLPFERHFEIARMLHEAWFEGRSSKS